MALYLCYSINPPHDHTKDKAIYLDQEFYASIVDICLTKQSSFPILHEIAELRYKSPTIILETQKIEDLTVDLNSLASSSDHAQIPAFNAVCKTALERGCALTVSGDMYPELT